MLFEHCLTGRFKSSGAQFTANGVRGLNEIRICLLGQDRVEKNSLLHRGEQINIFNLLVLHKMVSILTKGRRASTKPLSRAVANTRSDSLICGESAASPSP